jgi:multimeric flavodoxin WrbA
MKIVVLNGSPKGETSVTMQYVRYIQKTFPEHDLAIVNVASRIKKIEREESAFQEIVEQVRVSDGVLWAFPLYILLVHANYKRFIELVWERGVEDAFADKYTASLSTSIHFFDHTAHNYMHAICDDLGMRYLGAYSPAMDDLLKEKGQKEARHFARRFFESIERGAPTARSYPPVTASEFAYTPGPATERVDTKGKRIVVLTDAEPHQANLHAMIDRFRAAFDGDVETINLHELDIKGGCLGCLRCGYNYECAYLDKDEFINFYNTRLKTADAIVFAGTIRDRYLSATWKNFFDRSFFNTHTPSLAGKQFAFLISGPLAQNPNLRQILEAWTQFQYANLVGFVTDEPGDAAQIDALLQQMARDVMWCAEAGFERTHNFLGVGGIKIFRDDVWGRLRTVFQADHRAYKRMGIYNFPQKQWGVRALNAATGVLFKIPAVREGFMREVKAQMVRPYQKIVS